MTSKLTAAVAALAFIVSPLNAGEPNSFETHFYSSVSQQNWYPVIELREKEGRSNANTVALDITYKLAHGTYRRHINPLFHRIEAVQDTRTLTPDDTYATQFVMARPVYEALLAQTGQPYLSLTYERRIDDPSTVQAEHFTRTFLRMDAVSTKASNDIFNQCRTQGQIACTL